MSFAILPNNAVPQAAQTPASDLSALLTPVLEAVNILGPGRFQIGASQPVEVPLTSVSVPRTMPELLSEALWPQLYNAAYSRPFHLQPVAAPAASLSAAELMTALRSGFPEGTRWSPQWQVYQADANGGVHVRKGDCCRYVTPGAYVTATPGAAPGVGASVSLLLPTASSVLQPGFYHIHGGTPDSDHDMAMLGRLYLNTHPDRVVAFMQRLAASLDSYRVPFRAKTLTDPAGYDRTDSTVFYAPRRYMPFILSLLQQLLRENDPGLMPDVPLFSKKLADGVGVADDPGQGLSFGQVRCMMLADALVRAWLSGQQTVEARLAAFGQRLAEAGLSLAAPHLAAGNIDIYHFPA
ncbi:T3SS effector HopA1 family protein [Rhizobium paknamense]|uniref:Uncharacterized protein n=1 Tax=Rhizobium paknamense TaxID=1206817 RepID=A0ABU0I936_9HYPH|nr:T3SS effector HopA1 family protein [Rhizobium paknamense]MDQ0454753.1 hypothetical protein [Rhizobium paknamense]